VGKLGKMGRTCRNVATSAGSLLDATKLESRTQILCGLTDDAMEAIRATFVERRKPVYSDEG
jgi:hypothetical protein